MQSATQPASANRLAVCRPRRVPWNSGRIASTRCFSTPLVGPDANQDPPCERTGETTVVQTLHLMNAPSVNHQLTSDDGRVARLAASSLSAEQIVEELYLATYSRLPSGEELAATAGLIAGGGADRRQGIEDLLWALLNTPEFVFKN